MKKFLFLTITMFCGLLLSFPDMVFSDTANNLKNQIEKTNNQIETINSEIKVLSNQIAETAEEKESLAKIIKELNLTRSKLLKEREQIQKKITNAGLIINDLSTNIKNKESSIYLAKQSLSLMINNLNQNEKTPFMERLLSNKSFTDFSNEYNNIISLNDKIRDNINILSNKKIELEESKNAKEEEKKNLDSLKNNLIQKEQAVVVTKKEKDSLLSETKNKEIVYQQMLSEKIKLRDSFEKELLAYESQLKYILDKKSLPKEGSAVLSWPLDYVLITSLFGERWGRMHSGLDFRASIGTPVKSVMDGEVIGTGDTDVACKGASFGKWVLVKHNNGLSSVYGHLSVISVKKGEKIKTGKVIGLSGNTGSSTAPHLHLGVYASDGVKIDNVPSAVCYGKIFVQPMAPTNAYLNPLLYLPKTTNNMYKAGVL